VVSVKNLGIHGDGIEGDGGVDFPGKRQSKGITCKVQRLVEHIHGLLVTQIRKLSIVGRTTRGEEDVARVITKG